jgi:hypothetical protein
LNIVTAFGVNFMMMAWWKKDLRMKRIVLLTAIFSAIGIAVLGLSWADTHTTANLEPENGSAPQTGAGGKAAVLDSTLASGNQYIRFGQAPSNPSNIITRWPNQAAFANPIHFIDAYYGASAQFDRIEVNVKVEVASGTDGYYFSNTVFFPDTASCSPDCVAYMGLQTVGGKALPPGGTVDKMAIFSLWDSTHAIPKPGVTEVNFDGEGVGKSLRVAYNWQVGHTYQLVMYYDRAISNGTTNYWTAAIVDQSPGISTILGSIQTTAGVKYAQSGGLFHERYSGPVSSCANMNPSQVKFFGLTAYNVNGSGHTAQYLDNWTIYQANVAACNGSFWVNDLPGAAFRSGVNTAFL